MRIMLAALLLLSFPAQAQVSTTVPAQCGPIKAIVETLNENGFHISMKAENNTGTRHIESWIFYNKSLQEITIVNTDVDKAGCVVYYGKIKSIAEEKKL